MNNFFVLVIISSCLIYHSQTASKYYDGPIRPYNFGYSIEGNQHRHEEKDEKGQIMGEFGFITADGVYHVTAYATDENGNFKILFMKNIKIGLPGEPTSQPAPKNLGGVQGPSIATTAKELPTAKPGFELTFKEMKPSDIPSCSGCVIPEKEKPRAEVLVPVKPPSPLLPASFIRPDQELKKVAKVSDKQIFKPLSQTLEYKNNEKNVKSAGPNLVIQREQSKQTDVLKTKSQPMSSLKSDANKISLGSVPVQQTGAVISPRPIHAERKQIQEKRPNKKPSGVPSASVDSQKSSGVPSASADFQRPTSKIASRADIDGRGNSGRPTDSIPQGFPQSDRQAINGINAKDRLKSTGGILYKFNYTVGYHGHHEKGDYVGAKDGGYFFVGRDGLRRTVDYNANEFGFQPHIKVGPAEPQDIPKEETEKQAGLKGYEFKWYNV